MKEATSEKKTLSMSELRTIVGGQKPEEITLSIYQKPEEITLSNNQKPEEITL